MGMRSGPCSAIRGIIGTAAIGGVVTVLMLGCRYSDTTGLILGSTSPDANAGRSTTVSAPPPCSGLAGGTSDLPLSYRARGKELVGDVDGDGRGDRVTLRADERRPAPCRYVLVVEFSTGVAVVAPVRPLSWPGTDPVLLLL